MKTPPTFYSGRDIVGIAIAAIPLFASSVALIFASYFPAAWTVLIAFSSTLCAAYIVANLHTCLQHFRRMTPLLVLATLYFLDLLREPSADGARHAITLLATIVIILFYVSFGSTLLTSRWFRNIIRIESLFLIFTGMLQLNQKNYDVGSIFYGACVLFYMHTYEKRKISVASAIFLISFCFSIGIFYDFRALLYLSLFIIVTIIYMSGKTYTPIRSYALLIYLISGMAIFFYFYIHMDDFDFTRKLNILVEYYSGRQLASGRQILWPAILEIAMTQPLTGLGGHALPKALIDTEFSSHNYYLQLFLQKGYIGLALLLWYFFLAWKQFERAKWKRASINFAAATFLTLLLHNLTEVVMFQNALIVALPAWIVISLGASQALHEQPPRRLRRPPGGFLR